MVVDNIDQEGDILNNKEAPNKKDLCEHVSSGFWDDLNEQSNMTAEKLKL